MIVLDWEILRDPNLLPIFMSRSRKKATHHIRIQLMTVEGHSSVTGREALFWLGKQEEDF